MTPDFTLALSSQTIELLRRVEDGWHLVGSVDVADPGLTGELAALRRRGEEIAGDALFGTKLLIPNEQIRYLTLDTTRVTEDDVRAALEGSTPYAVDDLVYDFVTGGGRTYIAAVARQTLVEAEDFASAHKMAPLSFCAAPKAFTYLGEAFFGPTRASRDILPFGTFLDRDPQAVAVTGRIDGGDLPKTVEPSPLPSFMTSMAVSAAAPDQHGAVLTEAPEEDAPGAEASDEDQPVETTLVAEMPESASEETPESSPEPQADPDPAEEDTQETTKETTKETVDAPKRSLTLTPIEGVDTLSGESSDEVTVEEEELEPDAPVAGFATRRDPTTPPASGESEDGSTSEAAPGFATRRDPTAPPRATPTNEGTVISRLTPTSPPAPAPPVAAPEPANPPPAPAASREADQTERPDITVVGAPLPAAPTTAPPVPSPAAPVETTVVGQELPAATRPEDTETVDTETEDPETTVVGMTLPSPDVSLALAASAPAPSVEPPAQSSAAPVVTAERLPDGPGGVVPGLAGGAVPASPPAEAQPGFFSRRRKARADRAAARREAETAHPTDPAASEGGAEKRRKRSAHNPRFSLDGKPKVGGKPRYLGLILTVVLLIFMAAVAAMAAFSEDGLAGLMERWRSGGADETQVAAVETTEPKALPAAPDLGGAASPDQPASGTMASGELPALPGEQALPTGSTQSAGLAQTAPADGIPAFDPDSAPLSDTDVADAAPVAEVEVEAEAVAEVTPPRVVPIGRVLSPDEAQEIYALTGVWQRAPRLPLTPRRVSNGFDATLPITLPDRIDLAAIPSATALDTDLRPVSPPDPPGPEVVFTLDRRGFIEATPEGTILPSGAVVIAGRPEITPPYRGGAPEREALAEEDGLIVLSGPPPVRPPLRSGLQGLEQAGVTDLSSETPQADAASFAATETAETDTAPIVDETAQAVASLAAAISAATSVPDAPELPQEASEATAPIEEPVLITGTPPVVPPLRPAPEVAVSDLTPTEEGPPSETPASAPVEVAALEGLETPVTDAGEVIVVSGAPSTVPPVRAALAAPEAEAEAEAEPTEQVSETQTDLSDIIGAEAAAAAFATTAEIEIIAPGAEDIAAFRPASRPAALPVPPGALIRSDPALAGFRPSSRPASFTVATEPEVAEAAPEPLPEETDPTTQLAIDDALAAAIAGAVEETGPVLVDPTEQAVSVSTRPGTRPRNFERTVAEAIRAQEREAARAARDAERAAAEAADAAEEEENRRVAAAVPRNAIAQPTGPVAGSVASAATIENAINLRRINLIGVYGASNDRRAIVRLANGRYVRGLTVGDRLDGGRVAAIGDSYIDYVKRNRTIRLEVPG